MKWIFLISLLVIFMCSWPNMCRAESYDCGTALVIAMDTSASVSLENFEMQAKGLAQALSDPAVIHTILNQPFGRIAIIVVQWSTEAKVVIPWTIVASPSDVRRLANAVSAMTRQSDGMTNVAGAISTAVDLFQTVPCNPTGQVVDVSGDGPQNIYGDVEEAQAKANAFGVVVNGLAIISDDPGLPDWYRKNVQTGLGSFTITANGSADFARAMRNKLALEIAMVLR